MPAFSTVYLPDTTTLLVPTGATSIDVTLRRITLHLVDMPGGSSYSVREVRGGAARVSPRDWRSYTTFEPGDPTEGAVAVDVIADIGPAEDWTGNNSVFELDDNVDAGTPCAFTALSLERNGQYDSVTRAVFPAGSTADITVTIAVPEKPTYPLVPYADRPFDALIGRVWLANPRFTDAEHENERAYLGDPAGSIDKYVANSAGEMNPAAPRYPFDHERISRYVLFSAVNPVEEPDRSLALQALRQRLGSDGPRRSASDLLARIPHLWAGEL
ncbi:hypothetical protein ACIP5Y_02180 [Nocardia sp. NPDC088792]|uniref:hypothetical protein n=1 Tax=Nocardia sp. NPDC088792 TaxID=3364332 RepID=UPI0038041564